MKVLLTGATGFLGGHIADVLLKRGYSVRAIYRKFPKNYEKVPWFDKIEWYKGDITSLIDLTKAAQGCNAIIHAAARTDQTPSGLENYLKINVEVTKKLTEIAQNQQIRLVFVSTANVFAPSRAGGTEQNPFCWGGIGSGYATSKYLAQKAVLEACQKGLDAVVVNPTFMIGGFDTKPSSGAIILHVLKEFVVFYPKSGGKNFIYVRDAAIGVINALELGHAGKAYLLANQNLDYRTFMTMVAQKANRRRFFIPIPKFLLIGVGRIVSFLDKFFKTNIELNYPNAILLTTDNYYSAQLAVDELKLPQTAIEIAVEEAIRWFEGVENFTDYEIS